MQAMARESWTDERLADLNARVDRGFEQVDRRFEQVDRRFEQVDEEFKAVRREMKEGFDEMNVRFDALHGRFDSMIRAIFAAAVVLFSTTFAALAGILITQA